MYLLIQIALRKKITIAWSRIIGILFTFLFGLTIELFQYNGIPTFGRTYDPLDILMYAMGVLLGFFIDILIIDKFENSQDE